ncbi:hypothetical protein [Chryseobacterium sp. Leaf394]|uniref:hypothetical protein n=1 Tax=Chryseobacterium sp. Leaf394 TaxID=1736361 RepID=UPI0007009B55|nr:hypothetical protein [Chryseobacterium sp. Leaf394]KQS91986.1 hypothetical protein ASG21_05890 [Chryseobacterium sp. Leaf394]
MEDGFEINIANFKKDIKNQKEELNMQFPNRPNDYVDNLRAKIIITDDKDLRRIYTYSEKVIFLTSKEYQEYQKLNPFNMYIKSYSKLFKCDDFEDLYVLKFDGVAFGNTYLIKKSERGYVVTIIDNWIS